MMSKEVQGWWWKKNPRGEDDETRLDVMYMAEKKRLRTKQSQKAVQPLPLRNTKKRKESG